LRYLHSIGIALPDEKGGDVPMEGSSEGDENHDERAESQGDNDVTEEEHVDTPSTSVANHTQSQPLGVPQGTSVALTRSPSPALDAQKSAPLKKKSAPKPKMQPPAPRVKAEEEPLPGPNINERVRSA